MTEINVVDIMRETTLFLIVVSFLLSIIFCRKSLGETLDKFICFLLQWRRVSIKKGDTELEMESKPATDSPTTVAPPDQQPPPALESAQKDVGDDSARTDVLLEFFKALASRDQPAIDRAHKELILAQDNPEMGEYWDSFALKFRYVDLNEFEALKKLEARASSPLHIGSLRFLGECYAFQSEPKKKKTLLEGHRDRIIKENAANTMLELVSVTEEIDGRQKAKELLLDSIAQFSSRQAELLPVLAKIYIKEGEKLSAIAAYELCFALSDEPEFARFSAAYDESESGFKYLSAKNYEMRIRLKSDDSISLNNLAVLCEELDLPGKSVDFYKKSVAANETLAMSNMANIYIQKGLYEEAKEVLEKAISVKNPHANVFHSLTRLKERKEKEAAEWQDILKRGIVEQEFVRNFGRILFLEKGNIGRVAGKWQFSDNVIQIIHEGDAVKAEWVAGEYAFILDGKLRGSSFEFLLKKSNRSKSVTSLLDEGGEKGMGYEMDDKIHLYFPQRKENYLVELCRIA